MVQLPAWQEVFPHSRASTVIVGSTHPPLQWVHMLLSLGVKWAEREACHPSPSNDEIKNECSATLYASMVCRGAIFPYVLPSTFVLSLECWDRIWE